MVTAALVIIWQLSGPPIPVRPEGALRADLPLRVIDSLFVWAPEQRLTQGHRSHAVGIHELANAVSNLSVGPDFSLVGKPAFDRVRDARQAGIRQPEQGV